MASRAGRGASGSCEPGAEFGYTDQPEETSLGGEKGDGEKAGEGGGEEGRISERVGGAERARDPEDPAPHGGDPGARTRDGGLRSSRRRGDRLWRRHRPLGGGGLRGDVCVVYQRQRGHRGSLADAGAARR